MTTSTADRAKDLLSLAMPEVEVSELVEQIDLCVERPELQGPDNLQPRTVQLAAILMSQAVRLIRVGTREAVSGASVAISRFMITPRGECLAELDPEAHRLLRAAMSALSSASPASSAAGEAMVLRSWGGKARRLLGLIVCTPGHVVPISELLDAEDGALAPIVDLESAGLLVRYRDDDDVVVCAGTRKVEEPLVQAILSLGSS